MTQQLSTLTPARLSTANGAARKAYMVGGGIGSLAAAAFLIRDRNINDDLNLNLSVPNMKIFLRYIGSVFLLGMLVWAIAINVAIAPAHAAIRQLEETPGQMVYQARQILQDQQGKSWQAIAFKRTRPDHAATIYLRLVGFPGTAKLDHSQTLTLIDSLGQTVTATDISPEMFSDKTQVELNAAEYDLQPILMQLTVGVPLRLLLPTLDSAEIALNVSPEIVEEWQSLASQK